MTSLFKDFHEAQRLGDGRLLASCLVPINTDHDPHRLHSFAQISNYQTIQADVRHLLVQTSPGVKLPKAEANAWIEVFVTLWKCVKELDTFEGSSGRGDWLVAFKSYKDVCTLLVRGYTNFGFQAWTVPCLYTTGKYLRMIAIRADRESNRSTSDGAAAFANGLSDDISDTSNKNDRLEEAARTLQQMFNVCRSDDSDLTSSRKWGIYSMSNLLFKTFFKLNNIALTKTIIRALDSPGVNLPPFTAFPKSHRCTFSYYRGLVEFLQENYAEAEAHLADALSLCHRNARSNREQILTYLIPTHILVHQQLPSTALLSQHPAMSTMFLPLCKAIKAGNLAAFDRALNDAEVELVERRIYLTLERTRDLCMRNLFRKVFQNAGWEETRNAETGEVTGQVRRTRIRIDEFEAAIKVTYRGTSDSDLSVIVERDEVECFLANMIYKGYMKGYIAREQGKVVLSKAGAFPGTGL